MNFSFSHAPFPGPTVSDALAAASRAAGDAYARRVLRPSGDEGGSGNGGAVNKALLSLLSLLPSSSAPPSSLSSLPASECSALPSTDSLALLRGLNFPKDEKEDNYGRVVAISPLSPSSTSASSSSSCSCSCSCSLSLPRPSPLDLARDEGSLSVLEAEVRVEKAKKVRPRRERRGRDSFPTVFFSCSFLSPLAFSQPLPQITKNSLRAARPLTRVAWRAD